MTLDEAIRHCEEVADGLTEQGKCAECAAEHRQLAEWLKELKGLRLLLEQGLIYVGNQDAMKGGR